MTIEYGGFPLVGERRICLHNGDCVGSKKKLATFLNRSQTWVRHIFAALNVEIVCAAHKGILNGRSGRCGRMVKTQQGLYGHYRFKHGIEYLTGEPVRKTPYMREISESIQRIAEVSRDKKEFEAWRREKIKAERGRDYNMWRSMKDGK